MPKNCKQCNTTLLQCNTNTMANRSMYKMRARDRAMYSNRYQMPAKWCQQSNCKIYQCLHQLERELPAVQSNPQQTRQWSMIWPMAPYCMLQQHVILLVYHTYMQRFPHPPMPLPIVMSTITSKKLTNITMHTKSRIKAKVMDVVEKGSS